MFNFNLPSIKPAIELPLPNALKTANTVFKNNNLNFKIKEVPQVITAINENFEL